MSARTHPSITGGVLQADMANAIRSLVMDAVENAKSGHPGMPMGMADVATVLFRDFMRFNPQEPGWPDRDRFVLSAGHGSMLLYAILHLTGYAAVTIDEIKRFRQLGAITAGHPEYGHCPGVETTTGPLGQGLATAVGMALAERILNARFGDDLVGHWTYVIAGDGCLMEGISHEAIDLAGHLKLGRLVVLFDDNGISIDGATSLSTSTDQLKRFEAAGWHVTRIDGHDESAIAGAIAAAQIDPRPSLIACRTVIGFGAPTKQGTEGIHGAPLGATEIEGARARLGWRHPAFEIPAAILSAWRHAGARGALHQHEWACRLARADDIVRREFDEWMPANVRPEAAAALSALRQQWQDAKPALATRQSSKAVLDALAAHQPNLIGGSADLTHSNLTRAKGQRSIKPAAYDGTYIHYGIREHAMGAAMNGLALHGGAIPYGGTFLAFSDYCRSSIRLSALMGLRVVYVMTHDSIGLGEDGPTHQPVEHVASLRAMPNLLVLRPADAIETADAWQVALQQTSRPSVICLTRQALPTLTGGSEANRVALGGYLLDERQSHRDVTLIGSGSEVEIAVEAARLLAAEGITAAVVSMPCHELFAEQTTGYQKAVLGSGPRIAVEAGVRFGWDRWIGPDGDFIGMTGFGASAPAADLYRHFGITPGRIVDAARAAVRKGNPDA